MKYPESQYKKLKQVLSTLVDRLGKEILEINPSALHFLVYQQMSSGQRHNAFVQVEDHCYRYYQCSEDEIHTCVHFTEVDDSFELYPNNTNDNNIETAMRKVIKELQ